MSPTGKTALLLPAWLALLLGGCSPQEAPPAEIRPVRAVTLTPEKLDDTLVLTGNIQSEKEIAAAFRIGGRMIERPVNVGDRVTAGQLIAKLDPQIEENSLRAARAELAAAEGQVTTARNTFDRQERLMQQGFTTRPRYDEARQALNSAQAKLEYAEAQVELAQDRLEFGELRADTAGVVTARGAEPGEVVQPGQMIVRIARDDGRDAVFDVSAAILQSTPHDPTITIALTDDPAMSAKGRVREISPQADPITGTFTVRVGLENLPDAMRLGASVIGTLVLQSAKRLSLPASALTATNGAPAVWVIDPDTSTVQLRNIDIVRFDPGSVAIAQGLDPGEIIVVSGTQALHPGQRVRILPAAAKAADG
jgi:RND family efflux transporter MFP subunit